jgi:signal transduction histidine kinase
MRTRCIILWAVLPLLSAITAFASETPRSILVLEQSDIRGPFYAAIFSGLRTKVNESSTGPVTLYVENLDLIRFRGDAYEASLRDHLATKYADHPIGVIVAVGSAALGYAIRWRDQRWSGIPIVFAFIDETAMARSTIADGVTGRFTRLRLADMVTAARDVVPDLKSIALVGDAFETQPVFGHFRDEVPQFSTELEVIDLTGLPMSELKRKVAALPGHSAILYTAIYSDGAGTYFPPADAVAMIEEVANRPIITPAESYLGRGVVGGYVAVPSIIGAEAADVALRILDGVPVSSIPIDVGNSLQPIFDWQQLRRWGVDERTLPVGSEIRNRVPTLWEAYAWEISAIVAVLVLQAGLIIGLLHEHGRRRRAEMEARQRMSELALVSRRATAGELSSTIAHELNQPLGAIQNNAGAAQRLLAAEGPDLAEIARILADIKRDNKRAGEVIDRVRRLVRKLPAELQDVDLNETMHEVFEFLGPQASAQDVSLERTPSASPIFVKGDLVQLQQVVLNLVLNAVESVAARKDGSRRVVGRSYLSGASLAEVEIADTGPGVPEDRLSGIFEPFVTTKSEGMGMGLSIARSIIEAHGGRIWAENARGSGAVFRFTLPLAIAEAA